jgi:hypothetical protein
MTTTDVTQSPSRYTEAVLLGLLAHDLVAGVVCWAIGFPGAATFLWAVGTGLSLGYSLIWLVWQRRTPRHHLRLAAALALLAAMITTTVVGAYVVSDALGILLIATVFLTDRLHDSPDHRSVFPQLDRWYTGADRSRQRTGA